MFFEEAGRLSLECVQVAEQASVRPAHHTPLSLHLSFSHLPVIYPLMSWYESALILLSHNMFHSRLSLTLVTHKNNLVHAHCTRTRVATAAILLLLICRPLGLSYLYLRSSFHLSTLSSYFIENTPRFLSCPVFGIEYCVLATNSKF